MAAQKLNPLILRADAGPEIGLGHLMRTVAIGQEWQDRGGGVTVVTALPAPEVDERLQSEGFSLRSIAAPPGSEQDALETAGIAAALQAEWIVVDGYRFHSRYQKILKERGCRVLFIDDYGHAEHYSADIVLNQNLSAQELLYAHRDPDTLLLLGPRYAMIRREFILSRHSLPRIPGTVKRLLVSLGGADPENITLTVIRALEALGQDAPHASIVVGGMNPHRDLLAHTLTPFQDHTLVCGGKSMPDLMIGADAAITGGGSTTWELLFMGVPFLTIILAENQARVVRALEAHGLTWNLGEGREISPNYLAIVLTEFLNSRETLVQFSERGKHLVDGSGTARIAMHLCGDRLWLRGAKEGDCRQLWEWANDPVVRQASFHPAPILIEDHKTWFFRKLSDPDCFLFIAMDREDQPVGQIRFDLVNEGAEVDYSIDRRFRGKGLGLHLLLAGLDALRRRIRINTVKGYVKKGNLPSIRSFERAGFVTRGMKEIEGSEAIEFIRDL